MIKILLELIATSYIPHLIIHRYDQSKHHYHNKQPKQLLEIKEPELHCKLQMRSCQCKIYFNLGILHIKFLVMRAPP